MTQVHSGGAVIRDGRQEDDEPRKVEAQRPADGKDPRPVRNHLVVLEVGQQRLRRQSGGRTDPGAIPPLMPRLGALVGGGCRGRRGNGSAEERQLVKDLI